MLDLSDYDLVIGRPNGSDEWFAPIVGRGRAAVFVDTGFLRALLWQDDQFSSEARPHFESAGSTNFYTTNLVLAEVVRQIAKGGADYAITSQRFASCTELIAPGGRVWICAPPRDVVLQAYDLVQEERSRYPTLDLTDSLSLIVLDYAEHKRVFGFDDHFRSFGAALEPRG